MCSAHLLAASTALLTMSVDCSTSSANYHHFHSTQSNAFVLSSLSSPPRTAAAVVHTHRRHSPPPVRRHHYPPPHVSDIRKQLKGSGGAAPPPPPTAAMPTKASATPLQRRRRPRRRETPNSSASSSGKRKHGSLLADAGMPPQPASKRTTLINTTCTHRPAMMHCVVCTIPVLVQSDTQARQMVFLCERCHFTRPPLPYFHCRQCRQVGPHHMCMYCTRQTCLCHAPAGVLRRCTDCVEYFDKCSACTSEQQHQQQRTTSDSVTHKPSIAAINNTVVVDTLASIPHENLAPPSPPPSTAAPVQTPPPPHVDTDASDSEYDDDDDDYDGEHVFQLIMGRTAGMAQTYAVPDSGASSSSTSGAGSADESYVNAMAPTQPTTPCDISLPDDDDDSVESVVEDEDADYYRYGN